MRMLAAAVVVWMCVSTGCQSSGASGAKVQQIKTAADLKTRMDAGNVLVVHSLDAEHYAKAHVPGAANIDYEKMTPESLPADKAQPLVFYCAGGMCPVGEMAASKAAKWGYTNVAVYSGGIKGWQSSGMQVATGP